MQNILKDFEALFFFSQHAFFQLLPVFFLDTVGNWELIFEPLTTMTQQSM